ncbi:MAG: type II toxin-antitoxin system Phd/YefM family antitoxin [Acidimicrobiales bacterium]
MIERNDDRQPDPRRRGLAQIGVRALRNEVSALVRRAGDGERIVITVDGRPMAQLGPLEPDSAGLTLDDLAAAGLVEAPRLSFDPAMPAPFSVPADVRLDRVVDQIRGRQ